MVRRMCYSCVLTWRMHQPDAERQSIELMVDLAAPNAVKMAAFLRTTEHKEAELSMGLTIKPSSRWAASIGLQNRDPHLGQTLGKKHAGIELAADSRSIASWTGECEPDYARLCLA